MLHEILNNSDLEKYITSFEEGQIIFLEGDDSQDLFILVSGRLDILKGNKKIAEITEAGDLFGEMSFLLGARRTASVKAKEDGKALRIPKGEITTFLGKFPDVSRKITRLLAQRLDETSQVLFGLKEFCDQLPDAVILTNRDGKILSWNSVAEKLYGRSWDQMHYRSAEEIYEEPHDYKNYLDEVQSRYSIRDKILKVRHPEKGTRYISTSTTILYDGHHNFQGVLSLGRDITKFKEVERKNHYARNWIISSLIILCILATATFFAFPYLTEDSITTDDIKKRGLRNQLGKDFILLRSLLVNQYTVRDRVKTNQLMKEFFNIQDTTEIPYHGLVLLDRKMVVFAAHSIKAGTADITNIIGSHYSGIEFQGSENSIHKVLTLYRANKEHPMGQKGVEVAFEIFEGNHFLGWLVFQMDVESLEKKYNINEEDLKKFQFKRS
ncbi:cyclic nucleotide-binding domain-containing protein [Thermodesulfobacteriota bacterium]